MDGIHDLGGMAGFGRVEVEPDEPRFHEAWERTAWQLAMFAPGMLQAFTVDAYRHAVERMEPTHYLQARYYERMLTAVATLLVEKGVLDHADLERRAGGRFPLAQPAVANAPEDARAASPPRYRVGEQVRVRQLRRPGHTRVPRFVRGRVGTVLHVAPRFPYPDANAHDLPTREESTYHVEFAASQLWPGEGAPGESVVVDLWETYLEPAS